GSRLQSRHAEALVLLARAAAGAIAGRSAAAQAIADRKGVPARVGACRKEIASVLALAAGGRGAVEWNVALGKALPVGAGRCRCSRKAHAWRCRVRRTCSVAERQAGPRSEVTSHWGQAHRGGVEGPSREVACNRAHVYSRTAGGRAIGIRRAQFASRSVADA